MKRGSTPDEQDNNDIHRTLAGDNAAFARLVIKYQDRIFHFILKHIRNRAIAEELTQEAFLDAYKALSTFAGRSRFSTWLMGIALNRSRNYVNRAPEMVYGHVDHETHPQNPSSTPTWSDIDTADFEAILRKGLTTLPNELREVFLLISIEGLSYQEAADIIDAPIGTVKNRMFRARTQLKDLFLQENFLP
ncbi:sigma-70 family RNA polymerase sigma factor [Desulfovibrio inopinatus]|uniref:sigma-70 family RNA polymerase sigma factor n=1 Tax=Desulfovibrio inopinatus TaxID=102109 RepID=UPI0004183747|nr:sigma-70 family RNA polymerase sigma factor [Desulfovibrio inopinatus]